MKNILITGCSSGLGLALCKQFLNKNYKVIGISRTQPEIDNPNFTFVTCDLSNLSTIKTDLIKSKSLMETEDFEFIYLNAGTLGKIDVLKNLTIKEYQSVYDLNVYANKEILDLLMNKKIANVIAISSGAAINGSKGWSAYSLSKAGLNMLINLYANEFEHTKFLAVAPGVIETPMTDIIRFKIDDTIFTSAKRLKDGEILSPTQAAKRLININQSLNDLKSGSFIDVRTIKKDI